MRRLGVLTFLLALIFLIAGPPSVARAAQAQGCSGEITSFTASGVLLDGASAPGEGASEDRPFVIDTDGKVSWTGSTDAVIRNATWEVTIGGFPARSGTFSNEEGTRASDGEYSLSELPDAVSFLLSALGESKVEVTATVTGDGGTCTASGFITGKGSPYASPLFYSGIFFLLMALLLFLWMLAITV